MVGTLYCSYHPHGIHQHMVWVENHFVVTKEIFEKIEFCMEKWFFAFFSVKSERYEMIWQLCIHKVKVRHNMAQLVGHSFSSFIMQKK